MRVAGIDCGTNSIRLMIADVDIDSCGKPGKLHILLNTMTVVRLGEGVDKTGRLSEAAMQRTFTAVDEIARQCDRFGVEKIRFTATSASRDAQNRDEFVTGIRARLGIEPEVISGDEEARLTFLGAMTSLPASNARTILADCGGGSTEFVLGKGTEVLGDLSTNMGSVRVTERFFPQVNADSQLQGRILPGEPRDRAVAFIDELIAAADTKLNFDSAERLVAVAGTATTLAATALHLHSYDPQKTHGHVFSSAQFIAACEEMMQLTVMQRRNLEIMPAGRADVIGGGALIWQRIVMRMEAAGVDEVLISEHDILDGVTASAALI